MEYQWERASARPAAAVAGSRPPATIPGQVGNLAMLRMIQRQTAPTATVDDQLTGAQVAKALAFYRGQPKLFTAQVIEQMRSNLDLDPAGGIDAELVHAVARFQREQQVDLTADGMVGPSSAPRLFPGGLAAEGQGAAFGGAAQAVFDRWSELGTVEARAQALGTAINNQLAEGGVPPLKPDPCITEPPELYGHLDYPKWKMDLNRAHLAKNELSQRAAMEIAETVYHEARHAEQWFWMARYLAGQGYSAAGIGGELVLPAEVAKQAKQNPIEPGTPDAVVARGWYESVYGSGAERREKIMERVTTAATALERARQRNDEDPTPQNEAALARATAEFDKAHELYEQLPVESDAFVTGPLGRTGVRGTAN